MTITELEQVIQDCFLDIYHKKYIGRMLIQKLDPVGYCIKLGMDRPFQPTVIYAELEDKDFIKFLREDIKSRRFNMTCFGELNLTYQYDPTNNSCCDK